METDDAARRSTNYTEWLVASNAWHIWQLIIVNNLFAENLKIAI